MDTPPVVCILQGNHIENEFFGQEDINHHPRLLRDQVMVSSMRISQIILTNYESDRIENVEQAGRGDHEWCKKEVELSRRINQEQEAPKNTMLKDGILYFKNRLYIPNNTKLKTEITKGCYDSHVT